MIGFLISTFITIAISAMLVQWGISAEISVWIILPVILVLWFVNFRLNAAGAFQSFSLARVRSGISDGFQFLGIWLSIMGGFLIAGIMLFLASLIY
jgi:hypothetical protein